MSTLRISSTAFDQNMPVPSRYTCDGADVTPPLVIENVPVSARSLALIVDDPDAPGRTWVHWVVWNIGINTTEIREGTLPTGAAEGMNDFRKHSYGGPCPPSGTHRYFFKLYALDTMLDLGRNTTKAALEQAMKGHIKGQAELVGTYARK
jgi:Raf kinase inhibitor-like YbhB/YbcL family protein